MFIIIYIPVRIALPPNPFAISHVPVYELVSYADKMHVDIMGGSAGSFLIHH